MPAGWGRFTEWKELIFSLFVFGDDGSPAPIVDVGIAITVAAHLAGSELK